MARSSKTSKPKTSKDDTKSKADPVEDAVIIEETPPEPLKEDGAEGSEAQEAKGKAASEEEKSSGSDAESPDATEALDPVVPAEPAEAEVMSAEPPETEPVVSKNDAPEPPSASIANVIPLLVGGLAAGFIGFVIARYAQPEPEVDPNAMTAAEIGEGFAQNESEIESLRVSIAPLATKEALEAQTGDLLARLDQTDATLSALAAEISVLQERIATLELRPVATGIEADAFDGELSAFRDQLDAAIATARTEIEAAKEEAEQISEAAFAAEQSAALRAALASVETAAVSGAAFADPLNEITGLSEVDIPSVLTENAEGAPTLSQLQENFPDAARQALADTVIADPNDAPLARIGAFLRAQTGARSLAPRDGDDPDAILSRAEAALRAGDVGGSLAEISTLPEDGQSAMSDWIADAETFQQMQDGLATLRQSLSVN